MDFKSLLDNDFTKYTNSSPIYTGSNEYITGLAANGNVFNPSSNLTYGYKTDLPFTNNFIGKDYTSGVMSNATTNIPLATNNSTGLASIGAKVGAGLGQNPNNTDNGLFGWLKDNKDAFQGIGTIAGIGFGLWNAYNQYQAFKENKKNMEQMRKFNEENQARQRHEWARQDANRASISAAWNR